MGNYGQNVARRRGAYVNPKESWAQYYASVSYLHVKQAIGEAAEDLGWALRCATTGQKLEMWQAWEEYFCG
jgi:hypothetical protein